MISANFYSQSRLIYQFLDGKVPHYPVKDPSITVDWYEYRVKQYENLYTITAKVFGNNMEYMWTYIADNNPPRQPDDWMMGDVIRLPKIIVRDSDTLNVLYSNVK